LRKSRYSDEQIAARAVPPGKGPRADELISKRLGHSGTGITYDRYVTVYRDRDAEAAEAFAKIVS